MWSSLFAATVPKVLNGTTQQLERKKKYLEVTVCFIYVHVHVYDFYFIWDKQFQFILLNHGTTPYTLPVVYATRYYQVIMQPCRVSVYLVLLYWLDVTIILYLYNYQNCHMDGKERLMKKEIYTMWSKYSYYAPVNVNSQGPPSGRPRGFWHFTIYPVKVSTLICTFVSESLLFL